MTEKMANQIANMKKQTIGVEVEMNGITREKATIIAASFFKTDRYEFMHEDIETLQGLLRALRKAGAQSSASRGCGVHIHIGLGDHNAQTLTNLANIMAAHEEQIGRAIKIDEDRTEHYCRTVNPEFIKRLNATKPRTMNELADIWYKANHADFGRNDHYNHSRYHMLNLHATFTKGTIEFRLFQFDEESAENEGGINCEQLLAYVQLCLAMSELAKELKYASPKPQQMENEKYAFRCWMLRLPPAGMGCVEQYGDYFRYGRFRGRKDARYG